MHFGKIPLGPVWKVDEVEAVYRGLRLKVMTRAQLGGGGPVQDLGNRVKGTWARTWGNKRRSRVQGCWGMPSWWLDLRWGVSVWGTCSRRRGLDKKEY